MKKRDESSYLEEGGRKLLPKKHQKSPPFFLFQPQIEVNLVGSFITWLFIKKKIILCVPVPEQNIFSIRVEQILKKRREDLNFCKTDVSFFNLSSFSSKKNFFFFFELQSILIIKFDVFCLWIQFSLSSTTQYSKTVYTIESWVNFESFNTIFVVYGFVYQF